MLSIKFHTKKSVGAYVYLAQEPSLGLQILQSLKYDVLKCKSRFTLRLETAKNTHYIKKCFK